MKLFHIDSCNGILLDNIKPLSEPMLTYAQLDFEEQNSMKFP